MSDYQRAFEVVRARGHDDTGDWEIAGPQPGGPCLPTFEQKTHEAMQRFAIA